MSLVLQGIRKQQADETHLYDVSAEFTPGLNVLAGPTAAGKTSLLRIIAGLDRPNAGSVKLMGRDITQVPVRKRRVAIVYQQYINYPNFTVFDNIASPLRLAKMSADDINKRVREAAALLSIDEYLTRMPSELSGGQQQRTAIARALVKDADIILFDEPLVNLDYKLREQLRREMRTIFSKHNKIAIYATTEPLEAALLGDNLVVIDEGKVLQSGSSIALMQRPASLRVAEILSDPRVNASPVSVINNTAHCDHHFSFSLGSRGQLIDGDYCVGLLPHLLQLNAVQSDRAVEDDSAVRFVAEVTLAEVSGSETFVHVQFGQHHWIAQQAGVHQYRVGDTVDLGFNINDLLLFDSKGMRLTLNDFQKAVG